jgi:hypothetical protein
MTKTGAPETQRSRSGDRCGFLKDHSMVGDGRRAVAS